MEKTKAKPPPPKAPVIDTPIPKPDPAYLSFATCSAKRLEDPQSLLLVLDLNGTLLYRAKGSSNYKPRPNLTQFLAYCLSEHSALIWSSATPVNVTRICAQLFTPEQRPNIVGEWARDTLGLTPKQYANKVQVYKRLDRIWTNEALQSTHPKSDKGIRWGQHNTLLLDDSVLKASTQPYSLVEMPEFTDSLDQKEANADVLGQVVSYLEEARMWDNVSSFVRSSKFEVDVASRWDWDTKASSDEALDDQDGGVKLI